MTLDVSCAFDGGNIDVRSVEGETVRLAIRPDPGEGFRQWFHFRLDGARERGCRVVIENASRTTYPKGWEGYGVVTSHDRRRWYRTPARYDGETLAWDVPPGHDALWFAYFAPYSLERHADLVARSAASFGVALERLGTTLDGRPIDCLHVGALDERAGAGGTDGRATSPKGGAVREGEAVDAAGGGSARRQVWVIARQHPGESMAEWWCEGFLKRLLDEDDATSGALRAIADIRVVPNMNPDGTFRGHLRTNAGGANLNREWAEPSVERSPEVFHVRRRMRATGVNLALDVHGDEALPYNFIAGTEGVVGWNDARDAELGAFKRTLAALNPDFQTRHGYPRGRPGAANPNFASNHVAAAFDCLAMTLEMPFKDTADTPRPDVGWSPERAARLGRSFVDAIHLALTDRLLAAPG